MPDTSTGLRFWASDKRRPYHAYVKGRCVGKFAREEEAWDCIDRNAPGHLPPKAPEPDTQKL